MDDFAKGSIKTCRFICCLSSGENSGDGDEFIEFFTRSRSETMLSQTVDNAPMQAEQRVRKAPKCPPKSNTQELRSVFLGMDATSSVSQQKLFVNRLGQFVTSQLNKENRGEREENVERSTV